MTPPSAGAAPGTPETPRLHAGVILFHDGRLAVPAPGTGVPAGRHPTLPCGPVPPHGDPAGTALDAALAATGVPVDLDPGPCLEVRSATATHLYFRAASRDGAGRARLLTREQALHEPFFPWVAGETILRSWAQRCRWAGRLVLEDPHGRPPERVRAGAVVIRDEKMLLIECRDGDGAWYEIPGGGVEPGEVPHTAVVRELREETGLSGTVGPEIAQVHRGRHPGHYFLVAAEGRIGPHASLDIGPRDRPVWVPLADLPHLPLWPKRLAWRIAHWHRTGWPARPAVFSDSLHELGTPCDW